MTTIYSRLMNRSESPRSTPPPAELHLRYERSATEFLSILDTCFKTIKLDFSPAVPFRVVVARAVVERQISSLRASLVLGKDHLGHLATAYVRQACEELIWMMYIAQLDGDVADRLVLALGNNDLLRGLIAFRDYAGTQQLMNLGFPQRFLEAADEHLTENKSGIGDLGIELDWPQPNRVPSVAWVADQVGKRSWYNYLHSASSRAVHFSVGEAFRNTWWEDDLRLRPGAARQNHQYAFALSCLIKSAVETLVIAFQILGHSTEADLDEQEVLDAARRFAELGSVPLIIPEEFNLRPDPMP